MAYSPGPSDPAAPNGPSGFASVRLSQEEAEGFAATLRPSWELDEAFSGPGSLLDADLRAVEDSDRDVDVDVVAAPGGLNGTHGIAGTSIVRAVVEPERSIIIDPTIPVETNSPAGPPVRGRHPTLAPTAPAPQPMMARSVEARDFLDQEPALARHTSTRMWVGLASAIVVIVGAVGWLSLSGEERPAPLVTVEPKSTSKTAVAPPPTQTSAPPPVLPPATPSHDVPSPSRATAGPPPFVAPTIPIAPIPVTPVVTAVAPTSPTRPPASPPRQASPPQWTPPPRPALRPRGNGTIVRDVPF